MSTTENEPRGRRDRSGVTYDLLYKGTLICWGVRSRVRPLVVQRFHLSCVELNIGMCNPESQDFVRLTKATVPKFARPCCSRTGYIVERVLRICISD